MSGNRIAGGFVSPQMARDREGPNVVLVGVCVALVTVGLTVLGMNLLNRRPEVQPLKREPISAAAEALKYSREELYRSDLSMAEDALTRLLRGVGGSQLLWENAESGNRGITWNSFENRRGCRDIERRTIINGAFHEETSTACRDANGHFPTQLQWSRK